MAHRTQRNKIKRNRAKLRKAFLRELEHTPHPIVCDRISKFRSAGMKDRDIIAVLDLYEKQRAESKVFNNVYGVDRAKHNQEGN